MTRFSFLNPSNSANFDFKLKKKFSFVKKFTLYTTMLSKNTLVKDISLRLHEFNEIVINFLKSNKCYDDLHSGNYRLSYTLKNKEYEIFNGIDLSSYLFEAKTMHTEPDEKLSSSRQIIGQTYKP